MSLNMRVWAVSCGRSATYTFCQYVVEKLGLALSLCDRRYASQCDLCVFDSVATQSSFLFCLFPSMVVVLAIVRDHCTVGRSQFDSTSLTMCEERV
jgi:hypothetical protein